MIKVSVSDSPSNPPTHEKLVFIDEQSALKKDMLQVVGRFCEKNDSVYLVDTMEGNKYRCLSECGLQIYVKESTHGDYFIASIQDVINGALTESAMYNTDVENVVHNSNALYFSGLKIGLIDGDDYYLDEEIDNYLPDDFELHIDGDKVDFNEMPLPDRVTFQKVVSLSQRSPVNENLDNEPVQVNSLACVKKLESTIEVELRHGNIADAKKAVDELKSLVDEYNNAVPPAKGISEVLERIKEYESAIKDSEKNNEKIINEEKTVLLSPEKAASNILEMNTTIPLQSDLLSATLELLNNVQHKP
ncbi:hypothetical protein [Vibrio campbellii]|uniref:hypothetical protein n=1 Tax=Vibrio campbellii TaxID=680 RepID=UPI003F869A5A